MKKNRRTWERYDARKSVRLSAPSQKKITATMVNVSLSGFLLADLSSSLDKSTHYKIEIIAANNNSIFLSGIPAWKDKQCVGIKISRYHFDSRSLFKTFINDLKTTTDIVNLLDNGWLDYLFKDDQGKQLNIQFC